MKHSDYITHINNAEDNVYLKSTHFPVNMRLFNTSAEYKAIIKSQCDYIKMLCLTKKEGYKKPHGMSSANAGLSFNIIAIVTNRNTVFEDCLVMINPVVLNHTGEWVETESNCGSIVLEKPIKVKRNNEIMVSYYDTNGNKFVQKFTRKSGAFTIQHEVDHNLGILITDL